MLRKLLDRFRPITHPAVARGILDAAGPGELDLACFNDFRGTTPHRVVWQALFIAKSGLVVAAGNGRDPNEALAVVLARLRRLNKRGEAARLARAIPDRGRARLPELSVRSERRTGRPIGKNRSDV